MVTVNDLTIRRAMNAFGETHQRIKVLEECIELLKVMVHRVDDKSTAEEELEELADVSIMVDQMRYLHGKADFDAMKIRKVHKFMKAIDEKENENAQNNQNYADGDGSQATSS